MELNFYKQQNIKIVAIFLSIVTHGLVVLSQFSFFKSVEIKQQVMQISFVAPSSHNEQKGELNEKSLLNQNPKDFSISKNLLKQKDFSNKKKVVGQQTSGPVKENSVNISSAESEPVFDAQYLNNPAPSYPKSARQRRIEGKVLLNVVVNSDGSPLIVSVLSSSGFEDLDESAIGAVSKWQFIPAKKSGVFVQANVIVPIEFKII